MHRQQTDDLLSYAQQARQQTLWAALCIPVERLEWAIASGQPTFGDILRHIAGAERYVYVEIAARRRACYPGHDVTLAHGYYAVMEYMAGLHQESMVILRGLRVNDYERYCSTVDGVPIPVWQWLREMVAHESHHRGQICAYLGAIGVQVPALFGLDSECGRTCASPRSSAGLCVLSVEEGNVRDVRDASATRNCPATHLPPCTG